MKKGVALVLGLLLCGGVVLAQGGPLRGALANDVQPPNFQPLGGQFCASPGLAFGAAPTTVSSTINVAGQPGMTANLEVDLQIKHTWVGDIVATLSKGAVTQILIDRPGPLPCGCGSNDIDVTLSALGTSSVEDACHAAPPAIRGTLTPSPGTMGAFNVEPANGDWTMTLNDAFPVSDHGVFMMWCLNFNVTGTTGGTTGGGTTSGGTTTPATSTWGVILLIAMFLGASVFFLRRRGSPNA